MIEKKPRIYTYPDPFLRQKSEPIESFDESLCDLVQLMRKIMKETSGIGLAAPQIGVSKRIIVVDDLTLEVSPEKRVLINPEILIFTEQQGSVEEGCLSVPEIYAPVKRPVGIQYRYYDENGTCYEGEDGSFWARVAQHELDHLDGILFIDRISSLQKRLIRKKLQKLRRISRD